MVINMQSGGVVPERIIDAQTITPGTEDQIISAGTYLRGNLTIAGDADLIPAKLPNDVNLFGVQGTRRIKEGLNVWSKYNAVAASCTATLSLIDNSTSSPVFQVNLSGEESLYNSSYLIGKTFALNTSTHGVCSFTINSLTSATYTNAALGTKTVTLIYNESTRKLTINSFMKVESIGKNIDLTINDYVKTLLEFVIDDDSAAYPNGAVHTDGYYYELLGQVSSANVMSLSDNALATVQQDYRDTIETEVSNANS